MIRGILINMSQIYPSDLELNRENIGFKSASVLEMKIDIIGEKFNVSVYDKRDSFGFESLFFINL